MLVNRFLDKELEKGLLPLTHPTYEDVLKMAYQPKIHTYHSRHEVGLRNKTAVG